MWKSKRMDTRWPLLRLKVATYWILLWMGIIKTDELSENGGKRVKVIWRQVITTNFGGH